MAGGVLTPHLNPSVCGNTQALQGLFNKGVSAFPAIKASGITKCNSHSLPIDVVLAYTPDKE